MKTRLFSCFLSWMLSAVWMHAQLHCTFTHYSLENGLSQNSVMDMVQDHEGLLWIATWDGVNRFDGYDFKVYKARPNNTVGWNSNRVDHVGVDKYGYVWCITYDNQAFRFNKQLETFEDPFAGDTEEESMAFTDMKMLDNGTVWLLTDDNGGVRVTFDEQTGKTSYKAYLTAGGGRRGTAIHAVFLDSRQQEWLLTDNGLLRIDAASGNDFRYFADIATSKSTGEPFFCALEREDRLFFGSSEGRIWEYPQVGGMFEQHQLQWHDNVIALLSLSGGVEAAVTASSGVVTGSLVRHRFDYHPISTRLDLRQYPIRSVYKDSQDEIWMAVDKEGTVLHFNPQTQVTKTEQVAVEIEPAARSNPDFMVCEDVSGNLWVHPLGGGLSLFDREAGRLVPFHDEIGSSEWRFSNKLHSIMSDRQGNLWLGTHSKGLEKVTFFKNPFQLMQPLDCHYDTSVNQVRSICEDNAHRLWVGTRDGKINVYTSGWQWLGHLTTDGRIAKNGTPIVGVAYRILQDSRGDMWIATKGYGVLHLQGEGLSYRMQHFAYHADDPDGLSSNSVYDILEDGKGRLWMITFDYGINYLERGPDGSYRFVNSRNRLKTYPIERCLKARSMMRDSQGYLWVATANGLLAFDENFTRPEDIRFHLFERMSGDRDGLGGNDIYALQLLRNGEVFVATFGGGLSRLKEFDPATGRARFQSFTMRDGLPTDVLYSLAEDEDGNLWIGSENGLSCMNEKEKRFENYLSRELGEDIIFEENTAVKMADGRLSFGSNRGILTFRPEQIHKNTYVPDIVFSDLKIAGQVMRPKANSPLPESVNSLSKLVLPHDHNTISFFYAALDMTYPENIRYAFRLEGFDKDWNHVGKQRVATYTNLPPGEYVFQVRSTNGANVWADNVRQLCLTIKPSFWETPVAYVLYVLIFLIVLTGGTYILFVIYRLKHEVSVEQQITNLKLRFFTNISHELRTPLTLIAGPLDHILKHSPLSDEVREQLQVVNRNTDRMLRLVNQILDFRKIQNNKMRLRVEQLDIVPFVRKVMDNFQTIAEEHRMDFLFESERPSLMLWVDADKVEKIIFNLLSNAFKYTQDGKSIRVFIHDKEKTVAVGVCDQGIGISKSRQASLFVRFESLLDNNIFTANSTGIGLSLVKELVEMHHATIEVDSKEGEGSSFIIEFPKGKDQYGEEVEFILSDEVHLDGASYVEVPADGAAADGDENQPVEEHKIMLLVEDNLELRTFLRTIFSPAYRILEASDGQEGYEKALQFVPDIIISDIMMPRKDGIELVKELRNNLNTSHIPIVLLTAKTDMDTKLKGMELGVDSYITKPFSSTYLEARVENLLARRQRLQEFYCEHLMNRTTEEVPQEAGDTMSPQDRKFMERLTALMEKNMDNGDLMVDDLVQELAVSRSVFFKKLKSLTGLAPIEFIKEMRVKRAAQLIETGDYNMTQIAYMVGINDPRYFSKCFKHRFGITPTEYKNKLKAGN